MGYKHTPAPWFEVKHFSEWLISDGSRLVATTAGSPAHLGLAHAKRDAANARLIAAAPDLLKAALTFEEYCDAMDAGDDVTAMLKYAEAQTARRAAIAKATGEPQ